MLKLEGVEAIIFDLGGVIIDIDFQHTFNKFSALSAKNTDEIKKIILDSGLLLQYELGHCNDLQFIESLRKALHLVCTNDEIEDAFLALLLQVPKERVNLLRSLSKDYRLFLLSNTNAMHYKVVNEILYRDTSCEHLEQLFERVFLSYQMGLAKPGIEIYKEVIKDIEVNPSSILFLDDNEANLASASLVGIQTALVSAEQSILRLLNYE